MMPLRVISALAGRAAALCARCLVPFTLLLGAACDEPTPEPPPSSAATDTVTPAVHYVREFVFVGERDGVPLLAPFVFTARERGSQLHRGMQGWLAHGAEWDAFLQDRWSTPPGGGVWKVLPRGDLRVLAGGSSEVEALHYRRGERTLRLTPEILRATWALDDEVQYRLFEGRLDLAGRTTRGLVLETYRVQRGAGDAFVPTGAVDWMFVTDGSSVHLLLSEAMGGERDPAKTFAWSVLPDAERGWAAAQIRWTRMEPVEPARRDAPVAWSFRIPGADMEGEVFSLGQELRVGADRPGRRAVLARHNVEGWVTIGEDRYRVFGLLRHSQE